MTTSTDPVAAYQEALKAATDAERKAEGLAQYVVDAGTMLQNWRDTRFSNNGVSYPIGVGMTRSINANGWPTALQVAQALSDYHTARHELKNAYARIPEPTRSVITPPPRD